MPIIKLLPGVVPTVKNRGVVYYSTPLGTSNPDSFQGFNDVFRAKPVQTTQLSPNQNRSRITVGAAASAWNNLTPLEQSLWNGYLIGTKSGYNLFVQQFMLTFQAVGTYQYAPLPYISGGEGPFIWGGTTLAPWNVYTPGPLSFNGPGYTFIPQQPSNYGTLQSITVKLPSATFVTNELVIVKLYGTPPNFTYASEAYPLYFPAFHSEYTFTGSELPPWFFDRPGYIGFYCASSNAIAGWGTGFGEETYTFAGMPTVGTNTGLAVPSNIAISAQFSEEDFLVAVLDFDPTGYGDVWVAVAQQLSSCSYSKIDDFAPPDLKETIIAPARNSGYALQGVMGPFTDQKFQLVWMGDILKDIVGFIPIRFFIDSVDETYNGGSLDLQVFVIGDGVSIFYDFLEPEPGTTPGVFWNTGSYWQSDPYLTFGGLTPADVVQHYPPSPFWRQPFPQQP